MALALLLAGMGCAPVGAAVDFGAAWDLVRSEAVAGRSVAWTNATEFVPLSTRNRMTASPISTNRNRIVVQSDAGGYRVQGGVVDAAVADGCRVELYAFLAEPFQPDPTRPLPRGAPEVRLMLVTRNGGDRLAAEVLTETDRPETVHASLAAENDVVVLRATEGTQRQVLTRRFQASELCS